MTDDTGAAIVTHPQPHRILSRNPVANLPPVCFVFATRYLLGDAMGKDSTMYESEKRSIVGVKDDVQKTGR